MSLVIEITTDQKVEVIEVAGAGPQGAKGDTGDQGPVGPGVPAGGVEFNLLEKASADDFDTRFTDTPTVRGLQLSTTNPADVETGRIVWNDGDEVPQFRSNGITVDLSLEMLARCRNVTGSVIPKGTAVCIVGASAQRISIAPSNRTQPGSACRTLGLTLEPIENNGFGKVSTFGLVRGLNTAGIDGAEGDELFVGDTPGSLTTTPPDAPARRLTVGYLVTKSTTQGRIFVSIRRGVRVDEIDDVQVESVADGDVLRFDDAAGRWENKPLGTAADADAGDFDAAGSADAVQSNLETHIDDATNPHQVTAEQVGLGDVPNLDTTDAVAKAHDQNTDTALAAGTADEVTAAQITASLPPDPTGEPDDLTPVTDDGAYVLAPRFSAADLFDPDSLAQSISGHRFLVGTEYGPKLWGRDIALPDSGQSSIGPLGSLTHRYAITAASAAVNAAMSALFAGHRGGGNQGFFVGWGADNNNYRLLEISTLNRIVVTNVIDGVSTEAFSLGGGTSGAGGVFELTLKFGRGTNRPPIVSAPALGIPTTVLPEDFSGSQMGVCTWFGFGNTVLTAATVRAYVLAGNTWEFGP